MSGDGNCWDLRGPDFETMLIGPITGTIIDADRLVRTEWANGLPNWAMYRVCLAGDSHLRGFLRDRCVAFAIARAHTMPRRHAAADEMGCLAGWDAYYRLLNQTWVIAGQDIADVAAVDPKTYRKLRNFVYAALSTSLGEYWMRMQVAVRQVWMHDRWVEPEQPRGKWSYGLGFGESLDVKGDGCFLTRKSTMSDFL